MLQFPRPPFCEDPRCCYPLITIHSGSNHDGYWALLLYILPAIAASESCTISGYVVDGLTSQALPGVKVMLFNALGDSASGPFVNGPSASPTVIDTHEHFVFTALPANRYALQAAITRDIYTFREGEGWLQETSIYVGPQTRKQSIIFHILPRTTLRGTVRDETGELQDKGAVFLYQYVRNGGRFELVSAGQALVDDRGRYVFADLTPSDFPPTYFPATTDLNRAALITVVPGKEVVATVQVTLTPAYEVRGKLGVPGSFSKLFIFREDHVNDFYRQWGRIRLDKATSEFQISGLAPGSYIFESWSSCCAPTYRAGMQFRKLLKIVAADISDLLILDSDRIPDQ